eukprot:1725968-Lingulodinium_polyedra.AAC.1
MQNSGRSRAATAWTTSDCGLTRSSSMRLAGLVAAGSAWETVQLRPSSQNFPGSGAPPHAKTRTVVLP